MKNLVKSYPVIRDERKHYVKHPFQIKEKNEDLLFEIEIGKWVAVDIHLEGFYSHLAYPIVFDTYEDCKKACDIHNDYYGWSERQVETIINTSVGSSICHEA